jgi:hypothetical protein
MTGLTIFAVGMAFLLLAQGAAGLFAPQRTAAYQMRKYRRILGDRPAEPGAPALRLYRIAGAGMIAIAVFLLLHLPA